jgi:hypothetical protein
VKSWLVILYLHSEQWPEQTVFEAPLYVANQICVTVICYVTFCCASSMRTVESTESYFYNMHYHQLKAHVYYEKNLALNTTYQTQILRTVVFIQHLLKYLYHNNNL